MVITAVEGTWACGRGRGEVRVGGDVVGDFWDSLIFFSMFSFLLSNFKRNNFKCGN